MAGNVFSRKAWFWYYRPHPEKPFPSVWRTAALVAGDVQCRNWSRFGLAPRELNMKSQEFDDAALIAFDYDAMQSSLLAFMHL